MLDLRVGLFRQFLVGHLLCVRPFRRGGPDWVEVWQSIVGIHNDDAGVLLRLNGIGIHLLDREVTPGVSGKEQPVSRLPRAVPVPPPGASGRVGERRLARRVDAINRGSNQMRAVEEDDGAQAAGEPQDGPRAPRETICSRCCRSSGVSWMW